MELVLLVSEIILLVSCSSGLVLNLTVSSSTFETNFLGDSGLVLGSNKLSHLTKQILLTSQIDLEET
jgi:hypothetical protein